MTPRTKSPPLNDHSYWRRLRAKAHPDQGGSHDLFVWVEALREHFQHGPFALDDVHRDVYHDGQRSSRGGAEKEEPDRIPFNGDLDPIALARRILALVEELEHPYSAVLRLFANCAPATHGRPESEIWAVLQEWCAEIGRDPGEVFEHIWAPGPDNEEGRG